MKLRGLIPWMLVLVLVAGAPVWATQDANRRFYANTILSWWPNSQDLSLFKKFVDESKQKGMNSISIDIPWNIELKNGTYDFADFDARLNYVVSKRLSAFVKLNMSTAGGQKPYWLTDEMLMATPDGKVYALPDGSVFPSLSHPLVLKKAEAFASAVAEHIRANHKQYASGEYPVAALVPVFNPRMTIDYPSGADVDYSKASRKAFVEWTARLQHKASALKSVYRKWGSDGLTKAPSTAKEMFFSYTIKNVFDKTAYAVRKMNGDVDVALQTGAGWEEPCGRTIHLSWLADKADWIIVTDLPQSNHSFTIDVARTSALGKKVATEIDAPVHINATNARYFNQGVRGFEHGASGIIVANWDLSNVRNNQSWPFLHDMGKITRMRRAWPIPATAIYLSVWDLVNGVAKLSDYTQVYDEVSENGKVPVDVLTDDVIISDPNILARYKVVYLPANWTIPSKVRQTLKQHSGQLKVVQPLAAGTLDEFGAPTDPIPGLAVGTKVSFQKSCRNITKTY